MSEYQYYEFQAIDRPLTDAQMKELRRFSSRAQITPTSFVNVYSWGDFKGDRDQWMKAYFDAFLYVANWGNHWLDLRVPARLLPPETISMYCTNECLVFHTTGEHVIVSFASEAECNEWVEDERWLPSLTPLRTDLMNGDYRSLYLGWLMAVQEGFLDDDETEPPVPPGLDALNVPLKTLADFLRLDPDLIAAAAEGSAKAHALAPSHQEIADWIAGMPSTEKDAAIVALGAGGDPHFASEFRQRAIREIRSARDSEGDSVDHKRRTIGQLTARAEAIRDEQRRREEEMRARETAKQEHEQAEARKKHIESLVGKEKALWAKVDGLIATRQAKRYDEAVSPLQDLRDLADKEDQACAFSTRMERLRSDHARIPALLDRLRQANLIP
ncbi:MAG: hypothetical protein U9Q79_08200 [Candidatus Hydrogenedentes bacterium]|nr:hypothetical protein [Candidatus Hydrogenedentota bacterium]